MSSIAREPPRRTISITDQNTIKAMSVMMPMTANGKRSWLRSAGMDRDLLSRIGIKDMGYSFFKKTCSGETCMNLREFTPEP
jgi:hypothetical protein